MNYRFLAIFMAMTSISLSAYSQTTVLFDSFEDQNLTSNPAWTGDLNDFVFEPADSGGVLNTLLRLNADPDPTRTQISTPSTTTTGTWEFFIRQDFSPSNFNRAFIFLMADRPNLNYLDGSNVSGYAVRTGDNDSPRKFRLVRFDEGDQTELLESNTEIEEGTGYSVRVVRSEAGEWRLYVSPGINGIPLFDGGPVIDSTYTESSHFGLLLRYSSGNVSNFYFDNFKIENSAPFQLTGADVISADEIELNFSYPVKESSLSTNNFTVTSLGSPVNTRIGNTNTSVILTYDSKIPDGGYTLRVEGVESIYGRTITQPQETTFSFSNPFSLISADITSGRSIDLLFSRPVSRSIEPTDFIINNTLVPVSIEIDTSLVELQFSSDLPSGEMMIDIAAIESEEGWQLSEDTAISAYRFGEPLRGDIVINEFLYRRAPPNEIQFVELYNTTDTPFDIGGWHLATDRGDAEIPAGTVLMASGFIVLTDGPSGIVPSGEVFELPGFTPLRTTGDMIVLKNSGSVTIDSLSYKPGWGGNESGVSLERKDPLAISIDPFNWGSSNSESGSTPFEENSIYGPDVNPPNLLFATLIENGSSILLRFDEFIDISDPPKMTLNGLDIVDFRLNETNGNELVISLESNESETGKEFVVEIDEVSDYRGNISGTVQLPVAQLLKPGDLVFNEVMFDPIDDDFDQLPNQSDYLELANRRPYAISLEGVQFHDQPDENGNIRTMIPISSESKWVPAHGFAVVYPEAEPMEIDSSRTGTFFGIENSITPHSLQIERSTLSLPLSGREIYFSDSLGITIDMVHYSEVWHNPNLIDTKGIALERINPDSDSSDASNWGSSSVPLGGTPGAVNSLYQTPEMSAESNRLTLSPNPFSPDADGHEDRLFISYSFDDPNYMLRARIFDRHGRYITTLADSHHAGFEGSLIWDGRHNNGTTGRIGIYIVHVEAYNSSTGDKKQFKEVAVLARKF